MPPSVNKFGKDVDMVYKEASSDLVKASDGAATMAVVTITVCLASDSTSIDTSAENNMALSDGSTPKLSSHADLSRLFSNLAATVSRQQGESLMAGEVLWAPESEEEVLTNEEVFSRYPDLKPLL